MLFLPLVITSKLYSVYYYYSFLIARLKWDLNICYYYYTIYLNYCNIFTLGFCIVVNYLFFSINLILSTVMFIYYIYSLNKSIPTGVLVYCYNYILCISKLVGCIYILQKPTLSIKRTSYLHELMSNFNTTG